MSIEIENYYEHLLLEEVNQLVIGGDLPADEELLSDIACLAMNNLPSRYAHHAVDMAFFLSEDERIEMNNKVAIALNNAIEKVMS
ncbi:MAG: late competence development ComFB family protein [Algicola sp.]|nr:late competence development ComFB family protein [Algicola sp.]